MHNNYFSFLFLFGLFLFSCATQRDKLEFGTLKGVIGIYNGNCMPSPGVEPCKAEPVSTSVFITKPSKDFKMDLLVDSILTNDKGEFKINLKAGKYSLFIKDDKEIVCDGFKCEKECYCTPFHIVIDSVTEISANINHASW